MKFLREIRNKIYYAISPELGYFKMYVSLKNAFIACKCIYLGEEGTLLEKFYDLLNKENNDSLRE